MTVECVGNVMLSTVIYLGIRGEKGVWWWVRRPWVPALALPTCSLFASLWAGVPVRIESHLMPGFPRIHSDPDQDKAEKRITEMNEWYKLTVIRTYCNPGRDSTVDTVFFFFDHDGRKLIYIQTSDKEMTSVGCFSFLLMNQRKSITTGA